MRNEINDGHEESSLVFTRSTFEGLRETPLSRDYFQVSVQCLPSPSIHRFSSRRSWIGSSSAKLSMKKICTVGSFRLTGSKRSKVRIIMENSFHAARVGYRLPDNFCSIQSKYIVFVHNSLHQWLLKNSATNFKADNWYYWFDWEIISLPWVNNCLW